MCKAALIRFELLINHVLPSMANYVAVCARVEAKTDCIVVEVIARIVVGLN